MIVLIGPKDLNKEGSYTKAFSLLPVQKTKIQTKNKTKCLEYNFEGNK